MADALHKIAEDQHMPYAIAAARMMAAGIRFRIFVLIYFMTWKWSLFPRGISLYDTLLSLLHHRHMKFLFILRHIGH